ncbi:MAG TPA: NAD-dependent succinate-semialdehyde dehydrogenase [Mycobacteriales bacterium]|jgi:succinate-semialdehyde dehydrogenase/glutarate-semialdehyde dehydrogenase|nr:NAD-dependent succinate-semialdehyde dehydrogenase [Mycobacteriales bacterium]
MGINSRTRRVRIARQSVEVVTVTAADEKRVVESVPKDLFIGGKWRESSSGSTLAVEDPSTEQALCAIADGTAEDAKAALDAACDAADAWAATPPRERGEILRRTYELMNERVDDLALLMTLEMGKPLAESRGEITYASDFIRWFSEQAVRIDGRFATNPSGAGRLLTMKQPIGPCLLITPWNFPTAMGTRKIGPALAAGCTMVVKPAQLTPLSMLALAEILAEAGLPGGVLNIISSSSASRVTEPLFDDPRLRKMSFTGSTPVGKKLMEMASKRLVKCSMELGGNAPFVVFGDADIDHAVDQAVIAKMRNGGESCVAANRFHVHESVAEEFAARLAERLAAMPVGRGTDDGVQVGPLIDADQRDKVAELVDDAVSKGAAVLTGAEKVGDKGHFFAPTVLSGIAADSELLREEIFGPVAAIKTFKTDDEAIAAANKTEYGLVAYVFTQDINRAFKVAEALEVGMLGLNRGLVSNAAAPFGGIKESGFGREGGPEGIDEYLTTKYVALDL